MSNLTYTTNWSEKIIEPTWIAPNTYANHELVVFKNLVRRINKLIEKGAKFEGMHNWQRVYGSKGKIVQYSSGYNWLNYGKDNEQYYVYFSVNFYRC